MYAWNSWNETFNNWDEVFKSFERSNDSNYWDHLVTHLEDGKVQIQFNVAGYNKDTLNVTTETNSGRGVINIESVGDTKTSGFNKSISKKYLVANIYDISNLKAKVVDGILTITIPVKDDLKPKKVTIDIE